MDSNHDTSFGTHRSAEIDCYWRLTGGMGLMSFSCDGECLVTFRIQVGQTGETKWASVSNRRKAWLIPMISRLWKERCDQINSRYLRESAWGRRNVRFYGFISNFRRLRSFLGEYSLINHFFRPVLCLLWLILCIMARHKRSWTVRWFGQKLIFDLAFCSATLFPRIVVSSRFTNQEESKPVKI
jgi:hypothetical protein